jgi:hypothetical protein
MLVKPSNEYGLAEVLSTQVFPTYVVNMRKTYMVHVEEMQPSHSIMVFADMWSTSDV